jgi:hypothetical protein
MAQPVELKVRLQDPATQSVPTLFANHIAIARAGTEVQFEFVAMDINVLATKLAELASGGAEGPVEVSGKTVAKIVVPLHFFMQLEGHLQQLFSAVKQEFALNNNEVHHERERRAIS